MTNEMPDEIWANNSGGTGNSGVWSKYETPHVCAGRGGKVIKSTRKTNFARIKYIRANKAVPEGWKSIAIKPPKHMVFCLNQKLDLKVFCYAYDDWSGEPKPWIEYWYDAPLPQPPKEGD